MDEHGEGHMGKIIHGHNINRNNMSKHSPTYSSWRGMRERCMNPNHKNYDLYKNRMDDSRWLIFTNFLEDMGIRPSKYHQLDRVDNSKGYSKENCRWATVEEQHRNHSRNIMVNFNGIYCLKDIALAFEVSYHILTRRIHQGWNIEDALMECQIRNKENLC